jgi:hypothetical protein
MSTRCCGNGWRGEPAGKPGSVADSHSSRAHVTVRLKRPTRGPARAARCGPKTACPPIWSCSGWGLPCRRCCHRRGALLPHHFNLTAPPEGGGWRCIFCGTFRGLAPPRHYLAPCPVEPGLSSPAGLHQWRRLSGRLPWAVYPARPQGPSVSGTPRSLISGWWLVVRGGAAAQRPRRPASAVRASPNW